MTADDVTLAAHYGDQALRLRAMAVCLPGTELKADLRAAAPLYEGFAEKLGRRAEVEIAHHRRDAMSAGETVFQMCVRHVAEQEARIVRQEALIERLKKSGSRLLGDAVQLLGDMHNFLGTMQEHVARLQA
jgi:hypothetical protein